MEMSEDKIKECKLFYDLELTGINNIALLVANLKDVNTTIVFNKRYCHFYINDFKLFHFFSYEIKNKQAV